MALWFLGKETQGGGSPTLYDSDEQMYDKDVYYVQGWKVTDPEILAKLEIPEHETVIAVPKKLMRFVPKDDDHGDSSG